MECDPAGEKPQTERCRAVGIKAFPTWDIGGTRVEGTQSLEELARLSGFRSPPPPTGG